MAVFTDLSGNLPASLVGRSVDQAYAAPGRVVTVSPVGVTTPSFRGEIIEDSSNNQLWTAVGLTSADWVPAMIAR